MKGAADTTSPPKKFSESLVEIVVLFAEKWHCTPFEVLEQDIDDFIIVANYIISLGKTSNEHSTTKNVNKKETRIKVNDKTATGGWF